MAGIRLKASHGGGGGGFRTRSCFKTGSVKRGFDRFDHLQLLGIEEATVVGNTVLDARLLFARKL